MNDQNRRFFSGNTVQQAVVAAASHYGIDPDEVAYQQIEKRHGFLKVPRRVVIEVDPERPRRAPGEKGGGAASAARPAPPAPPPPPSPAPAGAAADERAERPERPERPERAAPAPRPRREEGGERRPPRERGGPPPPRRPAERGPAPPVPARRRDRVERPRERWDVGGEIVELPERPRPLSERLPAAAGPLADAAGGALAKILEVAGLEVEWAILQGEDRLEIELSGRDKALLTAEEGELLLAIEHLLPRAIRGIAGDTTAVRVDCENFHELREERLRSLAQRVAGEVRRSGQAKKLPPMSPADRRIVHLTVADEPGVSSQSEGDGFLKRVRVDPG